MNGVVQVTDACYALASHQMEECSFIKRVGSLNNGFSFNLLAQKKLQ